MEPNASKGHGTPTGREAAFTRLLPQNDTPFVKAELEKLAALMIIDEKDELKDGADAEENLFVPAGYTYLGQFIDHDLTFDTTSNLDVASAAASNLRTPSLDLDCLYGSGPDDQPYMYGPDGASLLPMEQGAKDLLRIPAGNPTYGRAVIGDKRNDENSIVCQIQLAFIKFHNAVVQALAQRGVGKEELFARARREVTWTYQRIVLEDYLRRIVNHHTLDFFERERGQYGQAAYKLYKPTLWTNLPVEFSGAAYRFGHSMVRTGYRLNTETKLQIFDGTPLSVDSLVGFQPLPTEGAKSHVIDDWHRFFDGPNGIPGSTVSRNQPDPELNNPKVRLQWAYRIDPSLVLPLKKLPPNIDPSGASLAALNLLRGNLPTYAIATGQAVAQALGVPALKPEYLVVRAKTAKGFTFKSIDAASPTFLSRTPLWFYLLAEAQVATVDFWRGPDKKQTDLVDDDFRTGPASGSQLGPVGGRILAEVFNGVIDADPRSFRNASEAKGWKPLVGDKLTFWSLLKFAKLV
jgi:hypothetical protein